MKTRLFAFLLAGLASVAPAAEQHIEFALPELEGRISLGVFSVSGKLVRTLFVQAEVSAFRIGDNGLITQWDGRDDRGEPVPAGKYDVRGFVVGNQLRAEGEAFHFNDWIDSEDGPMIRQPEVIWTEGETTLLRSMLLEPEGKLEQVVVSHEEKNGLKVIGRVPVESSYLGTNGRFAYFVAKEANEVLVCDVVDPSRSFILPVQRRPHQAAVWRDRLYLVSGRDLEVFALGIPPLPDKGQSLPGEGRWLDANDAALLGADRKDAWANQGEGFHPLILGQGLQIDSLSAGAKDSVWVVARLLAIGPDAPLFVRQYSFSGEVMRQLKLEHHHVRVVADKTQEQIFVTEYGDKFLRTRGLRPLADGNGGKVSSDDDAVVDWEVYLEKNVEPCENFGVVEGKLVADAGEIPQNDRGRLTLPKSALQPQEKSVELLVRSEGPEIWLETADGLRLLPVGQLVGASRSVVQPEGDSWKVFVGNSAVEAEYQLQSIQQMAAIDAGTIEIP